MVKLLRRRGVLLLLLAAAMTACRPPSPASNGSSAVRIGALQSGGVRRSYWLRVPESPRGKLPVLIVFHGSGATGSSMMTLFDGADLERYGFLAVFPEAAEGTNATWALGCQRCTYADAAGVDDYRFVRDLLDTLAQKHDIDRARVYVTGFSLGGSFAFDLACRFGELVSGSAIVASLPSADELAGCRPSRPLEVLIMLGDRDPGVPWEGGGRYQYASADSSARLWASWNGCAMTPASSALPDRNGDGNQVRVTTYSSCRDDVKVRLFRVEGVGHAWPREDLDASSEIARSFFGSAPPQPQRP
ncbi:MAG TPA: PHB depolymerase family esterase [Gemmatimonadaceae bacterium]|nr:PHB depolymerase family esterase [Gemmatimonadaceae bacterium]